MPFSQTDERHLSRTFALARRAREAGNHPFGALLVDAHDTVLLAAENTTVTENDCTCHAELNLVRAATSRLEASSLQECTLYTSTEPCAMCAGGIYWSGIGRVVFALSTERFARMIDPDGGAMLAVSCRDVLSRGGRTVDVSGPHLETEAWTVHDGFWG
jgi:tRNA(Arg) A34 adenosine deaminase TadA